MEKIGVLTSGGDAPGMNAAVRAVVRTGLNKGAAVYAIFEGYQGMVNGGDEIRQFQWGDVGGILQKGGTVIGTARCMEFRERPGRLKAVKNLLMHGIDKLVIIGGDGSLTGATILAREWSGLLEELVESGAISPETAARHKSLTIMGLVGTIDNDMWGTDISIGADTALHRITNAIDAISSTAASHQRSFVVEVMGRRCGYLPLMSALSTGSDWVLIPESPPDLDNWEEKMCERLANGRKTGRRDSVVIVAEGARDRHGNPISCNYVKQVLEEKLNEDTRVTILGHVQRGGSPSVFDRNISTLFGHAAVEAILNPENEGKALLIGVKGNKITETPLEECLAKTNEIAAAIDSNDFERAMFLRGRSFQGAFQTVRTLVRSRPHDQIPGKPSYRIGVMNAGAPAPGMNTIARAFTRISLDRGHKIFGIHNGFTGLVNNEIDEFNWMSVNGWAIMGGTELGTNRHIPENSDLYAIARNIEENNIQALMIIGGWTGYHAAIELYKHRHTFPAFDIPLICIPTTIDNNISASELSIGADTALNNIVDAVDKIKQSAVASRRVFVVEVMGNECGYLAVMAGMASGAEGVYINEQKISIKELEREVSDLVQSFQHGKRLGLIIRGEDANKTYTTDFLRALLAEEGSETFTTRQAILGHMQQGGNPSPFDRILGTRMAVSCVSYLEEQMEKKEKGLEIESASIGQVRGRFHFTPLHEIDRMTDWEHNRPKNQWWLEVHKIAHTMSHPADDIVEEYTEKF